MNISILSIFPHLYEAFLATSLIKRAQETGKLSFQMRDFFSCVAPKERIDAPPFGPGTGMLLKPEVVSCAIDRQEEQFGSAFKIFFSPQGKKLTQPLLQNLAQKLQDQKHLMLIAARYEGMDTRVEEQYADEIISIGDYVLMGGDLPAMVFLEGLLRLFPGVVGKQASVVTESFSGPFVDFPQYTEPVVWRDQAVPEIVRSGNHGAIDAWRKEQAARKTVLGHFEWLKGAELNQADKKLVAKQIPSHYVVLMHDHVLVKDGDKSGTTSVTSLDIHDIARSAATYGLKNYFIVTPLIDQQKIVQTLLQFWQSGTGVTYNPQRHEAMDSVRLEADIDTVIQQITQQEGQSPLLIGTSARTVEHPHCITYYDQEQVWQHNRPVLIILGTGSGLDPWMLSRCDYILGPVEGISAFNHLSVRSAAAVILDRWLGLNPKNK